MKRVFYGIHSHTTKIYFVSPTRVSFYRRLDHSRLSILTFLWNHLKDILVECAFSTILSTRKLLL